MWAIDDARDGGQCAPLRGIRIVPKDAPRYARLATSPCPPPPPNRILCPLGVPTEGGGRARPGLRASLRRPHWMVRSPRSRSPCSLSGWNPTGGPEGAEGVGMGQTSAMMFSVMCRIGNNRNTIIRTIKNASKKTRNETNNAIPGDRPDRYAALVPWDSRRRPRCTVGPIPGGSGIPSPGKVFVEEKQWGVAWGCFRHSNLTQSKSMPTSSR